MKKLLLSVYLLGAFALTSGADLQVIAPNGTTYGYAYKDGTIILQSPGTDYPEAKPSQPDITPDNTYIYKEGQTGVILSPQGNAYLYDTKE